MTQLIRGYIRQALRQLNACGTSAEDGSQNITSRRMQLDVAAKAFAQPVWDSLADEVVIFMRQSYKEHVVAEKIISKSFFERTLRMAVQFGRSLFLVKLQQHFHKLKRGNDFQITQKNFEYFARQGVDFQYHALQNVSSILRSGSEHTGDVCIKIIRQQEQDLQWVFMDASRCFQYIMFLKWQLLEGKEMTLHAQSCYAPRFLRQLTMNSLLVLQTSWKQD